MAEEINFNLLAEARYLLLDYFDDNNEDQATTLDIYEYMKRETSLELKRSELNDFLLELCDNGYVVQEESDDVDYVWSLPNEDGEAKKKPKKKTKVSEAEDKDTKKEELEEKIKKSGALKMKAETTNGDMYYYMVAPDKFDASLFKGYWLAESDEALEYFIFDKSYAKNVIIALCMQLVRCDDTSIKVKKIN